MDKIAPDVGSTGQSMTTATNRRAFLTGAFRSPQARLRPPGSADEVSFRDDCNRCGACVTACPRAIVVLDREGLPVIEPARGGCTFCNACIAACPTAALSDDRPWPWRAVVRDACLSFTAITCRACEDFCETRAIRFRPQLGGLATPVIDMALCTGCAECVGACPASAIVLTQTRIQEATPC